MQTRKESPKVNDTFHFFFAIDDFFGIWTIQVGLKPQFIFLLCRRFCLHAVNGLASLAPLLPSKKILLQDWRAAIDAARKAGKLQETWF